MDTHIQLPCLRSSSHQFEEISHCNKSCSPPLTEDWRCHCCIVGNSLDALSIPVTVHVWWCCDDIIYSFSSDMLHQELVFTLQWLPPLPSMQCSSHLSFMSPVCLVSLPLIVSSMLKAVPLMLEMCTRQILLWQLQPTRSLLLMSEKSPEPKTHSFCLLSLPMCRQAD